MPAPDRGDAPQRDMDVPPQPDPPPNIEKATMYNPTEQITEFSKANVHIFPGLNTLFNARGRLATSS